MTFVWKPIDDISWSAWHIELASACLIIYCKYKFSGSLWLNIDVPNSTIDSAFWSVQMLRCEVVPIQISFNIEEQSQWCQNFCYAWFWSRCKFINEAKEGGGSVRLLGVGNCTLASVTSLLILYPTRDNYNKTCELCCLLAELKFFDNSEITLSFCSQRFKNCWCLWGLKPANALSIGQCSFIEEIQYNIITTEWSDKSH